MYFNLNTVLSYNKLLHFVIGNRGGGKSYSCKKWGIDDFLKNGKQFIYLRRYKTELDNIKQYFEDIKMQYPDHDFKVEGRTFYIDKKICGFAIPLSTAQKEKSTSYPNVNKIIFDEFIIDIGVYRYLKNEVQQFLDFCETVARDRDFKAVLLSNAITIVNPYFSYFNIVLKEGAKFVRGAEWVVNYYSNEDFIKHKKHTRFGKLISATHYSSYAIENNFLRDNNNFIGGLTGNAIYWIGYTLNGQNYGVYYKATENMIYINDKINNNRTVFTFSLDEHNTDSIYFKNLKTLKVIKDIKELFSMGNVRFIDQKTKKDFYAIFKLL